MLLGFLAMTQRHYGPLKAIVELRLTELGVNPFEAARRGGLERSFVNDLLIGRKKSVRGDNIGKLAAALEIDTASLLEALLVTDRKTQA